LLSSGPASAHDKGTIGWYFDFHKTEAGAQIINMKLSATEAGLGWANGINKQKGYPALYCLPSKFVLNGETLFDILQRFVEDSNIKSKIMAKKANMVGLLLYQALEEMFPCK
jgi:hypothetical protein